MLSEYQTPRGIIRCRQFVGCSGWMDVKVKKFNFPWGVSERCMTDNALDFLPLGKLNYPMRDRWRPSRVTLPVCKWAAGWTRVEVATINRKNEGAATVADTASPAHNMSLQPHSTTVQLDSPRLWKFMPGDVVGGCRHPARCLGQPVACLQPAVQHQTHLSHPKQFSQIWFGGKKVWPLRHIFQI